jgi:hypothetical protein
MKSIEEIQKMIDLLQIDRQTYYQWYKNEYDAYWDAKIFEKHADPTKMHDAGESLADIEGKIVALQWILSNNNQIENYEKEKS